MKAVRFDDYGAIEVLEVRDVPRPEPGPGQVLVAVRIPRGCDASSHAGARSH
jgi:NADPH:quinone reductase-like Zn-dependent oxidoreductase